MIRCSKQTADRSSDDSSGSRRGVDIMLDDKYTGQPRSRQIVPFDTSTCWSRSVRTYSTRLRPLKADLGLYFLSDCSSALNLTNVYIAYTAPWVRKWWSNTSSSTNAAMAFGSETETSTAFIILSQLLSPRTTLASLSECVSLIKGLQNCWHASSHDYFGEPWEKMKLHHATLDRAAFAGLLPRSLYLSMEASLKLMKLGERCIFSM